MRNFQTLADELDDDPPLALHRPDHALGAEEAGRQPAQRCAQPSRVERFELANLRAFNFMLYDCLAGGASRSLRIDTQGKLLGTAILDLTLPAMGCDVSTNGGEHAR